MAELAGRLRARLTVERWAGVGDGAGGFGEGDGWEVRGKVWAELMAAPVAVGRDGEAVARRGRFRGVMRPGAVDATCRLRMGERLFQVLAVTRDPSTPDRMGLLLEESVR